MAILGDKGIREERSASRGDPSVDIGATTYFDADGDNTAQAVKTAGGNVYAVEISNINTTDAFLQLFDLATGNVTVGTTTPKLSLFIPAGDGTNRLRARNVFPAAPHPLTALQEACLLPYSRPPNPACFRRMRRTSLMASGCWCAP